MRSNIVLSALCVVTLSLTGCDLAGELSTIQRSDAAEEEVLAKTSEDDDDCGCIDIEATLFSEVDLATFTAQGTIVGDLEGSISFTGDQTSVSSVSGETFPPLNPSTSSFTSQLEITTDEGTLTTRGVGVAEFGAFAVGTEFHHLVAGTGEFSGATGTLYFNVEGDESGTRFTEAVSGQICTPCDDDGDDGDDGDDDHDGDDDDDD